MISRLNRVQNTRLKPNTGPEADFKVEDNPFAFSPGQLAKCKGTRACRRSIPLEVYVAWKRDCPETTPLPSKLDITAMYTTHVDQILTR